MKQKIKNKKRKIDKLAIETRSWLTYLRYLPQTKIKVWKAAIVIMFLCGAASAMVWSVSINIHNSSEASKLSPVLTKSKSKKKAKIKNKNINKNVTVNSSLNNSDFSNIKIESNVTPKKSPAPQVQPLEGCIADHSSNEIYSSPKIFVSPEGKDSNLGTIEKPLASLDCARKLARLKKAKFPGQNIEVNFRDGTYKMSGPVYFDKEDSGNDSQKIIYQAYQSEHPIFTYGKTISGFHKTDWNPNILVAKVDSDTNFRQLYYGKEKLQRAEQRSRNQSAVSFELPQNMSKSTNDILVPKTYADWMDNADLNDLEIRIPHSYGLSILRVDSAQKPAPGSDKWKINLNSRERELDLCLLPPDNGRPNDCNLDKSQWSSGFNYTVYNTFHPFFFENNLQFVDTPGEWFLDRKHSALYLYKPAGVSSDNDIKNLEVTAPGGSAGKNETFLKLGTNTPSDQCNLNNRQDALKNISFQGLTFKNSNWLYPNTNGFSSITLSVFAKDLNSSTEEPGKRAFKYDKIPAAVELGCTSNINIDNDRFIQLGDSAIRNTIPHGINNLTISDSLFYQIAGSAIDLSHSGEAVNNVKIHDNLLQQIGDDYGGVGISVDTDSNLEISNNELRDISYLGIGAYAGHELTPNIDIINNVLANCGKDFQDIGGIYASNSNPNLNAFPLASDYQTRKFYIRGNKVIGADKFSWWPALSTPPDPPTAIYLDFFSEGILVVKNELSNNKSLFILNCETNNFIWANRIPSGEPTVKSGCGGVPNFSSKYQSTKITSANGNTPNADIGNVGLGLEKSIENLWPEFLQKINRIIPD